MHISNGYFSTSEAAIAAEQREALPPPQYEAAIASAPDRSMTGVDHSVVEVSSAGDEPINPRRIGVLPFKMETLLERAEPVMLLQDMQFGSVALWLGQLEFEANDESLWLAQRKELAAAAKNGNWALALQLLDVARSSYRHNWVNCMSLRR